MGKFCCFDFDFAFVSFLPGLDFKFFVTLISGISLSAYLFYSWIKSSFSSGMASWFKSRQLKLTDLFKLSVLFCWFFLTKGLCIGSLAGVLENTWVDSDLLGMVFRPRLSAASWRLNSTMSTSFLVPALIIDYSDEMSEISSLSSLLIADLKLGRKYGAWEVWLSLKVNCFCINLLFSSLACCRASNRLRSYRTVLNSWGLQHTCLVRKPQPLFSALVFMLSFIKGRKYDMNSM